ncbi:MAG: DNA topoisomerase IV subunit A [Bacilli bacterium]|nr:DNA topoisomerase IV subunit A [Bacilli bacterium]
MAKRKIEPVEIEIQENIHNETVEEIMATRYATYAKYVIQDRAIPDARDGLKPVQRRIIFSMYKTGNIFTRPTRKSAHTVGEVMGKYHPHGDSSIYEALVRMSQDWKLNNPLIDFQGNNGSINGDPAAAYRYTEARLSQIAEEMVRDIDKETVDMALTFDDTDFEPVVMPARFPNLLVNGSEGIAVALATEIPTHNLCEVIDAVIYRIGHVRVEPIDLMQFIPGPDFPSGGYIYKSKGLEDIYLTGRGRIEIAAKTEIVDNKNEKQIIVSEIPYKSTITNLVYEIDKLIHDKVVSGISEVRDESGRDGLRIAIDLKKEANVEVIHNYLMNKTGLRTSYSANNVAIVNGRPKTLNLLDFIDAFIDHQVDVITRRSNYDLRKSKSRLEVVDGLIKAVSILDDVVDTIRASKDKADAKKNIQEKFNFSEPQSEAIVMLQLYKLSNTDLTTLVNEKKQLESTIDTLNGILQDRKKLDRLLVSDLKAIASKYGKPRKTQIIEKEGSISIDKRDLISKEEIMLAVSRDGYIKYSSIKSYRSSGVNPLPGMKDGDACIYSGKAMTTDYLICFTNVGNFLYIPIHEINENKWKDEGKHINYLISLNPNEKIVRAYVIEKFRDDLFFILVSKYGQIKRLRLSDFSVIRYSKPLMCMKLLQDDEICDVAFSTGNSNIVLFTSDGNSSMFNENGLPSAGMKSGGVKAFSHLGKATISAIKTYDADNTKGKVILLTDKGCVRIYDITNTNLTNRLGKTSIVFRSFKNEPHELIYVKKLDTNCEKTLIRVLNNIKEVVDIVVDDYHVTPIDRYAKMTIDMPKKLSLQIPFIEGDDYISKDIESKEIKTEPIAIESDNENSTNQTEEKVEEEKGYTQISIFEDDDDF